MTRIDLYSIVFMEQVVDAWLRSQALPTTNVTSDAPSGPAQEFDPYVSQGTYAFETLLTRLLSGFYLQTFRL